MLSAKKLRQTIIILTLVAVTIIAFLIVSGAQASKEKVITGLHVANVNIGDLSFEKAAVKLDDVFSELTEKPIELSLEGITTKTTLRELGATFNTIATMEEAYRLSDNKNLLRYIETFIRGLRGEIVIKPVFEIDEKILKSKFRQLLPNITESSNAKIEIDENMNIKILPERMGLTINYTDIYFQIKNGLEKLEMPAINIIGTILEPAYTEDKAREDATILSELLKQTIIFETPEENPYYKKIEMKIPKSWVSVKRGVLEIQKKEIEKYVQNILVPKIDVEAQFGYIKKLPDENNKWAEIVGKPQNGQKLSVQKSIPLIAEKIARSEFEIKLPIETIEGRFVNETGAELGELALLGQGRSNFAGSPRERAYNIKKGISEKVNNVIIAPGETYSFNSYLGPVNNSYGWLDALTIFTDQELRPSPGGGLCQVSTTVYRATLYAGLKVLEKSNHSLYVHYYKAYGDGLDAAVYPGSKDLKFINDTSSYLILQAYTEGNDAFVNIYGTPDGRKVELIGPSKFFYKIDENDEVKNPISQKITWIQKIERPDGKVEENKLISTYRTRS